MDFDAAELTENRNVVMARGPMLAARVRAFGLYDEAGQCAPHADIRSTLFSTRPLSPAPDFGDVSVVSGPNLFAGFAPAHFGHTITCALGRLWALDRLNPKARRRVRLVYVTRGPAKEITALAPILRLFGIENPVRFLGAPTLFKRIYTAPDLFGERFDGAAAPEFVDWAKRRLSPTGPITPGRKVYVTRSGLPPGEGRYAAEAHVDRLMALNGFEVVAPETLPLVAQMKIFSEAETLVFAEGSAIHLHAFVKRPEQRVVVIKRRRDMGPLIERNMTAFDPTPPVIVDAIDAEWRPPKRKSNASVSVLDFDRLRSALIDCDALSPLGAWISPKKQEVEASLNAGLEPGERMLTPEEFAAFVAERRRG